VGISLAALGLVLTAGSLAGLVGSFFTARVIGRLGSKRVMVIGGLAYVAALPVIGWSTSAPLLIAGLVGLGLVDVFIDVAMNLQGSVVSAERDRPVMSRLHGLWSLGTVTGGLTAALIAGAGVAVTTHYLAVAVALAGAVVLVGPGLAPVDRPHLHRSAGSPDAPAGSTRWALTGPAVALGSPPPLPSRSTSPLENGRPCG
jgi:MFS family permease